MSPLNRWFQCHLCWLEFAVWRPHISPGGRILRASGFFDSWFYFHHFWHLFNWWSFLWWHPCHWPQPRGSHRWICWHSSQWDLGKGDRFRSSRARILPNWQHWSPGQNRCSICWHHSFRRACDWTGLCCKFEVLWCWWFLPIWMNPTFLFCLIILFSEWSRRLLPQQWKCTSTWMLFIGSNLLTQEIRGKNPHVFTAPTQN